MNDKKRIFKLTAAAAMVALSVVFTRFLGFSPEGTPFRFEIGFLPIAIIAYIAGPAYAGLGYLTADVIGSLFQGYAPNPWITLCQLASGIFLGFCFYKRHHSLKITIFTFTVIAAVIEILLKSPIFVFMYGWTWEFTLGTRALNALINLPIRITAYYFTMRALSRPLGKYL